MTSNSDDEIDFYTIPVRSLRPTTRCKLSAMLNQPKILTSPRKLPRDYRGLADLMRIDILTKWVPGADYTQKLLYWWEKDRPEEANLGKLRELLGLIDRYDVLDDTLDMFIIDAKECQRLQNEIVVRPEPGPPVLRNELLTKDDENYIRNGQQLQKFNAFVLYDDSDSFFAKDLITTLESRPYNLRLCKNRDLVHGIDTGCTTVIKMVTERCSKFLIIFSNEFRQSSLYTSFVQFSKFLTDEERNLIKIIPSSYKRGIILPDSLRLYQSLDFEQHCGKVNFYEKVFRSLVNLADDDVDTGYQLRRTLPALQNEPFINIQETQLFKPNSNKNLNFQSDIVNTITELHTENQLAKESELSDSSKKITTKIIKFFRWKKGKKYKKHQQ